MSQFSQVLDIWYFCSLFSSFFDIELSCANTFMSSTCQNIKTEYEALKTLKEAFALTWATAKETGDFLSVRQLRVALEQARENLENKLWEPWAKPVFSGGLTFISYKEGIRFPDPSQIEFHLEPEQLNGGSIFGTEFLKRLIDKQCLNVGHLDFLRAHPELIPESWKKNENGETRYINFTDTIVRDSSRLQFVFHLYWNGSAWQRGENLLNQKWNSLSVSAILAS